MMTCALARTARPAASAAKQRGSARLVLLWANALAALALCALLAGGAVWASKRPYFTIKHIQIQPAQAQDFEYVSPAIVKATLAGSPDGLAAGNFFSVDLARLRALFETVPWVRQAQVRRLWPDTLRVQLEEHQPLALWNEDQMLNTWGEAFNANQGELADSLELAHLSGPPGSEPLVVQRYAELLRWLAPLDLAVQQVRLSTRHAWSVELAVVGSAATNEAARLHLELGRDSGQDDADLPRGGAALMSFSRRIQRFVQAWPQLNDRLSGPLGGQARGPLRGRQVLRADLRYPNGFAITLSPAVASPSASTKR